jgi:hypothetical protein
MNNLKEGQSGYAHIEFENSRFAQGITAYVKITSINGEYLEFKYSDSDKVYKVLKEKFLFIERIV